MMMTEESIKDTHHLIRRMLCTFFHIKKKYLMDVLVLSSNITLPFENVLFFTLRQKKKLPADSYVLGIIKILSVG